MCAQNLDPADHAKATEPSGSRSALVAAEAARHDSDEQFHTLVALLPNAVFVNQGNRVVYMNRRGLELWRAKSEADIIGLEPLALIHPDDRERVRGRIRRILAGGGPEPFEELKILARDGAVIDVETTGTTFSFRGITSVSVSRNT